MTTTHNPFVQPARPSWQWVDYEPTPRFDTEADLEDYVLSRLNPYFDINYQVVGRHCSGKKVRIDAVLIPHDWPAWKDAGNIALGVEFKLWRNIKGTNDHGKWVAQCVDYSHTDWEHYGRLPIFTYPSFSGPDDVDSTRYREQENWRLSHLLGQFRVGELVNSRYYGWTFLLNGSHRQWSQAKGIEEARRTRLVPAVGSR
jgi:hypothetical protein